MISGYLMLERIAPIIVDTNKYRRNAELVRVRGQVSKSPGSGLALQLSKYLILVKVSGQPWRNVALLDLTPPPRAAQYGHEATLENYSLSHLASPTYNKPSLPDNLPFLGSVLRNINVLRLSNTDSYPVNFEVVIFYRLD